MNLLNIKTMQMRIFNSVTNFSSVANCQARLTTENDEIVSNCDPEITDKMSDISAISSAVIASGATQLEW